MADSQPSERYSSRLGAVSFWSAFFDSSFQAEQDKINRKLQEQDLLLDAARASIRGQLQNLQKEKAELQKEM